MAEIGITSLEVVIMGTRRVGKRFPLWRNEMGRGSENQGPDAGDIAMDAFS